MLPPCYHSNCRCTFHTRGPTLNRELGRTLDQLKQFQGLRPPQTPEEHRLVNLQKSRPPVLCRAFLSRDKCAKLNKQTPPLFLSDVGVHSETKSLNWYISMMLRNRHLSGVLPLTRAAIMSCIEDEESQSISIPSACSSTDEQCLPPSWLSPLLTYCRCCICNKLLVNGMNLECRHTACWNCILDGVRSISHHVNHDKSHRGGFIQNVNYYLADIPIVCRTCDKSITVKDVDLALTGRPRANEVSDLFSKRFLPALKYLEELDDDLADYQKRQEEGFASNGALENMIEHYP